MWLQVESAQLKLGALMDNGLLTKASSQRALLKRLQERLVSASADLAQIEKAQAGAIAAAEDLHEQAEQSDAKADRLRLTAVSLSKGITQMAKVREMQSEALDLRQRSEVAKEMSQHQRKQAQVPQQKVGSHICGAGYACAAMSCPAPFKSHCNTIILRVAASAIGAMQEVLVVQADELHAEAEAKRSGGDLQAAQQLENSAMKHQKQAIELTRSSEAFWTDAIRLVKAAARIAASADTAQRKAGRLTNAGKLASEAQAVVDAIADHVATAADAARNVDDAERRVAAKQAVSFQVFYCADCSQPSRNIHDAVRSCRMLPKQVALRKAWTKRRRLQRKPAMPAVHSTTALQLKRYGSSRARPSAPQWRASGKHGMHSAPRTRQHVTKQMRSVTWPC